MNGQEEFQPKEKKQNEGGQQGCPKVANCDKHSRTTKRGVFPGKIACPGRGQKNQKHTKQAENSNESRLRVNQRGLGYKTGGSRLAIKTKHEKTLWGPVEPNSRKAPSKIREKNAPGKKTLTRQSTSGDLTNPGTRNTNQTQMGWVPSLRTPRNLEERWDTLKVKKTMQHPRKTHRGSLKKSIKPEGSARSGHQKNPAFGHNHTQKHPPKNSFMKPTQLQSITVNTMNKVLGKSCNGQDTTSHSNQRRTLAKKWSPATAYQNRVGCVRT